jgi:hypothetical protein
VTHTIFHKELMSKHFFFVIFNKTIFVSLIYKYIQCIRRMLFIEFGRLKLSCFVTNRSSLSIAWRTSRYEDGIAITTRSKVTSQWLHIRKNYTVNVIVSTNIVRAQPSKQNNRRALNVYVIVPCDIGHLNIKRLLINWPLRW